MNTLYCVEQGRRRADQPAVVFLHGLGSSSADWALQLPVFAGRYYVLAPDLRAHGRSRDFGGRGLFSIEQMADDVAELLRVRGEPPAHVAGLSLGGCVAQALAIHHPERVRSLTLVNTFAKHAPHGRGGFLRSFMRLGLVLFAPMPVLARWVGQGLFPKAEQREFVEAAGASLGQNPRRAYLASMLAITRFDLRPQLHKIACPTLVVAGDRDLTVPLRAKELLQRSIPGAQFLLVADSGHATPYDQQEAFNRAVLDFIEAH